MAKQLDFGERARSALRNGMAVLALALLVLSACGRPSPAQSVDIEQESVATKGCPAASDDTQLLLNEAHGYCLLYPTGYDVFHPDEIPAVNLPQIVNAADVGMGDLESGSDLVEEAVEAILIPFEGRRQELQRDRLPELQIVGPVNLAHAASAELARQLVRADLFIHGAHLHVVRSVAFANRSGRTRPITANRPAPADSTR